MQNPFTFIASIINKIRAKFKPAPVLESTIDKPKKKKATDEVKPQTPEEKQAALENFISTTPDKTYEAVLSAGSQLIEVMNPKR